MYDASRVDKRNPSLGLITVLEDDYTLAHPSPLTLGISFFNLLVLIPK